MKRKVLLIAIGLAVIIGGILIGIDTYTSIKPIKIKKEKLEEDELRSITLMASQNWIKSIDRELFKAFEEETGIQVKVMVTPDNGYDTLLSTLLAGGSDAIDVFMYQSGEPMIFAGIPEMAEEIGDQPWVDRLKDWSYQANSVDGKLYGFSTWGMDYEGILYNKTYFEENQLKVPNTWNDFINLCDEILRLGQVPLYEPINGTWHTQGFIYAMTPVLMQENKDFIEQLNSSELYRFGDLNSFREGMTQLEQLLRPSQTMGESYFINDGQTEDWFGSYTSLVKRESVMMFIYSAYAIELEEKGSKDEWGMFPFPICDNQTAVSNGGGMSKFINKKSKHISEAKMLFDFLAKKENLQDYYQARTDLIDVSFKDVENTKKNEATLEVIRRSSEEIPTLMLKEIVYWDPNIYQYLQELSMGKIQGESIIKKMDEYRRRMFEAEGHQGE